MTWVVRFTWSRLGFRYSTERVALTENVADAKHFETRGAATAHALYERERADQHGYASTPIEVVEVP